MKYTVTFEWIKNICKCNEWGYEEGGCISTCRNKANVPQGHSWGKCNEESCPLINIK